MLKSIKRLSQAYDPGEELPKWISYPSFFLSLVMGLFICIIQRAIRPVFIFKVSRINTLRMGHMLLEIDWYLSESKSRSIDLFFFSTKKPVNAYLSCFAKEKILVLSKLFLFGAYVINRLIPGGNRYLVSLPSESFDFRILDSSPSHLTQDQDFEQKGKQLLSQLGITSDSLVVCFYIRDSMYGRKTFPNLDQTYAVYRDSDVENFVPAMEFLAEHGFIVIRMGREGNSPVNSKNPNIIDYCFSEYKSDFADFYLTSIAEFAICTDTGMTHFPLFFRKPIGIANIAGMHGLLHSQMVKFITFKRYYYKESLRSLSLKEILYSDLSEYKNYTEFLNKGITFIESTPGELVGLAKDMFDIRSTSGCPINSSKQLNFRFQDLVFLKRGIEMHSNISHLWLENHEDFLD